MQNQVDPQTFASSSIAEDGTNTLLPTEAQDSDPAKARKPFVEPTVSAPADVLETTKFFAQAVSSGIID